MGQPEMVDQPEKRQSFFDRVQIFAHDILDQRHLERRAIVEIAHNHRHGLKPRRPRRPQPPLARDQLVTRAVGSGTSIRRTISGSITPWLWIARVSSANRSWLKFSRG